MIETGFRIDNMNEHYFCYPLGTFVHRQRERGESRMVFWASVPHLWVDQYGAEPCEQVFGPIEEAGITIDAIVARPYNYTLFAETDSLAGRHTMAYYRTMVSLTAEQGVSLLALELWGALRDEDREAQYQNCLGMLRELCGYAKSRGVELAVGNVPYSNSAMMNALPEVQRLVGEAGCDNLSVALDSGAAWLQGESLTEWMDAFGGRLRLVYLSDARNDGGGYPLSRGCCAVENELEQLKRRGFSGVAALRMSQDFCREDPAAVDKENIRYLTEISKIQR